MSYCKKRPTHLVSQIISTYCWYWVWTSNEFLIVFKIRVDYRIAEIILYSVPHTSKFLSMTQKTCQNLIKYLEDSVPWNHIFFLIMTIDHVRFTVHKKCGCKWHKSEKQNALKNKDIQQCLIAIFLKPLKIFS